MLTGFLGSGKTTLLKRALGPGPRPEVAVIVNEFAESGVDQDVISDSCACCLLVGGGCACCERLEELLAALRCLLDDYERGRLAHLRHVVIETSGLADPLPIVTAVAHDPVLRHHFELNAVIAVVDGLEGASQLKLHPEVKRQALIADRLVFSKTDLVTPEHLEALERQLSGLSLLARVVPASDACRTLLEPVKATSGSAQVVVDAHANHGHVQTVSSLSITFDKPLDWVAFGVWLSLLVHTHGRRLLRIKGVVSAAGVGQVSINTVQHTIYPPEHLVSPPSGESARLVLIAQDLNLESIQRSVRAFQQAA